MIIIKNLNIFDERKEKIIVCIPQLEIHKKSFCLIQGSSGSGKTIFLKTLANQYQFFAGNILIKEKIYESYSNNELTKVIQFLNQSYSLFSHMTAEEQLLHPLLLIKKYNKNDAQAKINFYMNFLQITEHKNKYPRELSGGQRQRFSLIQKLILDAEILLLDEPTSGLEKKSKLLVLDLLYEQTKKERTILITSHDPEIINSSYITQKFSIE